MRKKRVLVVDDEETIRVLLSEIFKSQGYEAETAENGEKALQEVTNKRFDLIVTDYLMPKMDGLELTRKLKTINPSIPILVFTSNGPEKELLESGALACLRKPLSIYQLQMISQNILEGNSSFIC